jgi:hypothetical protein
MSPSVVGSVERIAEPGSVRRRPPGDFTVVTRIDSVAAVVPLVVPAIPRLGYHQAESVVQDIGRVDPEPSAPSGVANAERVIGNVTV